MAYYSVDELSTKKYAWDRRLVVRLTSSKYKKTIIFGNTKDREFSMNIVINKYMSSLKDSCTIKINNLTYYEIVQMIDGEFYNVEVIAGYKNKGEQTVFKGGVLYISNALGDRKTSTAIILCASDLVAKYGQKRLNLSLNSGINIYSALRFICKAASIPEMSINVSEQFKTKFITKVANVSQTAGSYADYLSSMSDSMIINSDGIDGSVISVYDILKDGRKFKLTSDVITLSGGYPRLSSENGLELTILPTFNFSCGDVIEIDNSIIDISASTREESEKNKGYYLDKDGDYVITEMSYNLENRGSNFSLNIKARSHSFFTNITSTYTSST